MSDFNATHIIITVNHEGDRERIPVQLVDGCLYTADEWNADAPADWERTGDGSVLFQGQVPTHVARYWTEKLPMSNSKNITNEQIKALRAEAGEAGDLAQAWIQDDSDRDRTIWTRPGLDVMVETYEGGYTVSDASTGEPAGSPSYQRFDTLEDAQRAAERIED